MGSRGDDRLVVRNAADTNIQKAAECQPNYEQHALQKAVQSVCLTSSPTADESAAGHRSTSQRSMGSQVFHRPKDDVAIH